MNGCSNNEKELIDDEHHRFGDKSDAELNYHRGASMPQLFFSRAEVTVVLSATCIACPAMPSLAARHQVPHPP